METKFIKIGDEFAIVFEQSLLDALKITASTPLSVRTSGDSIIVQPLESDRSAQFESAAGETFAKYDGMLKRLAE